MAPSGQVWDMRVAGQRDRDAGCGELGQERWCWIDLRAFSAKAGTRHLDCNGRARGRLDDRRIELLHDVSRGPNTPVLDLVGVSQYVDHARGGELRLQREVVAPRLYDAAPVELRGRARA